MATKISNQITFTEIKKIIRTDEYYTTTQMPELQGDENWSKDIPEMTSVNKYLWNYEETIYSLGEPSSTDPVIVGIYGESGASLQIKYISSKTMPTIEDNNVDTWSDEVPTAADGEKIYMTQKMSTDTDWSAPIQLTGDAGQKGKDGSDIEYVYYRSKTMIDLENPSYTDGVLTDGWTNSPQGISETNKCEYVSVRTKAVDGDWGEFSKPVLWSKWGEKGQDGDGVEYWYHRRNDTNVPAYTKGSSDWKDEPQGVTIDQQYEYVVQIKTTITNNSMSSSISSPALWAKYGEDGQNGVGISDIKNYYQVTSDTAVPNSWEDSMDGLELTPENKYLWNYEEVIYTNGNSKTTDPAIIGVYGDSGAAAIDFQIYSVDGFEFSENITSINLQTIAFQNGESITSEATYQWKWYNADYESENIEDKYENIDGATSSTFTVNSTDPYSLSSLKCEMTYEGITYSDYVTLTLKEDVYTSVIKFFDGSNVFDPEKFYIAAYVEIYKNGQLDETKYADEYYDGQNTILDDSTIETNISSVYPDRIFEEEEKIYFIHKNADKKYTATIGQYISGTWKVYTPVNKYRYIDDFSVDPTSNIVMISKQDVARSAEVNVQIYQSDVDVLVSRCSATVIDTNDPIVSDTAPTNVKYGQLWLDTSVNPYVLKIYTRSKTPYVLEETESLQIHWAKDATSTTALSYGDGVNIYDDETIELSNKSNVSVSYNTYTDAEIIIGKFIVYSDEYYYITEDASITRKSSTTGVSSYIVNVSSAQKITIDKSLLGEWVYFSQQNGGTVYTSIPLNGYSEGDLWIISDQDISEENKKAYPNIFNKYGEGTMLKTIESSDVFNEIHWIDAQKDVTETIANVRESFAWDETGIKVMRKVTIDGNETTPFYVHIDSTRMGFHSVEYENGEFIKDSEVVHIGVNSAVIKNANFIDDTTLEQEDYERYEATNGALFDCSVTFNQEIKMLQPDTSTGFVLKIEENGSLSLMITS